MDPLTHFLSGVVLNRAGLHRICSQAHWIAPLAAMAPDADVVAGFFGTENYLAWHRQWTHALVAAPAVALLPVALAWVRFGRRLEWKGGYVAALVAVAFHDLLDVTNMYGVRALLPFSKAWLRLDIFHIVDLWIWAVLLAAVLGPMLGRLVSREIGARHGGGRGAAIFALVFMLVYGAGRWLLHARAVEVLESRLYQGEVPLRVAALPFPANPLAWRGLVETGAFYATCEVNLGDEFDPTAARILHKAGSGGDETRARETARRTRAFQVFLDFSQFPLWRFTPLDAPEGAVRVEAMDLRFGEPPAPRFVATAKVTEEGKLLESGFRF